LYVLNKYNREMLNKSIRGIEESRRPGAQEPRIGLPAVLGREQRCLYCGPDIVRQKKSKGAWSMELKEQIKCLPAVLGREQVRLFPHPSHRAMQRAHAA
jgi:hypothetical protein